MTFAPATIAPVINANVKRNPNPNPNPKPNLNPHPTPNQKSNHYPNSLCCPRYHHRSNCTSKCRITHTSLMSLGINKLHKRPIYIGKKSLLPITFGGFGTKSACAKKPESHTGFLVSGVRDFSLPLTVRMRITSRAAVG